METDQLWGDKPSWGDIEEEERDMTGTKVIESQPDENGVRIRTVVEYTTNELGQKVKTTKNLKVYKKRVKISKQAQARKKWAKFGDCRPGEQGVTLLGEVVEVELTSRKKREEEEESMKLVIDDVPTKKETWMSRAQRLGARSWDEVTGGASEDKEEGAPAEGGDRAGGAYLPPSLRRGADRDRERDDTTTVRVTNLSDDTREEDLRELFRRFGPIQRVFLAKNKSTGLSRGFAFITFAYKEDAAKAIENLSGYGYDHLILNVEWARPSQNF
ncbi:Eukaryotic translation initiation factor 3 subunit G [Balamuthia mandrillaris]